MIISWWSWPINSKTKSFRSQDNARYLVVPEWRGLLRTVETCKTVYSDSYLPQLINLNFSLIEKRPELARRHGVILQHDIRAVSTSSTTRKYFVNVQRKRMRHSYLCRKSKKNIFDASWEPDLRIRIRKVIAIKILLQILIIFLYTSMWLKTIR